MALDPDLDPKLYSLLEKSFRNKQNEISVRDFLRIQIPVRQKNGFFTCRFRACSPNKTYESIKKIPNLLYALQEDRVEIDFSTQFPIAFMEILRFFASFHFFFFVRNSLCDHFVCSQFGKRPFQARFILHACMEKRANVLQKIVCTRPTLSFELHSVRILCRRVICSSPLLLFSTSFSCQSFYRKLLFPLTE